MGVLVSELPQPNTSQNFAIKGLDFNSNGGNGRGKFDYQIFPDRPRISFDHFLIRPSGHDQMYCFMRDEMMQTLMHDVGMESQAARPCVTLRDASRPPAC